MNPHQSFWYNYSVLWTILLIYSFIDVIIWPSYQSSGISISLYDKLWFSSMYAFMAISAVTMFSISIPILIWLFNRLMVESLFYYLLQGKLPSHVLPWLSLGTSSNLYIVSFLFIILSFTMIRSELRWKKIYNTRRSSFKLDSSGAHNE